MGKTVLLQFEMEEGRAEHNPPRLATAALTAHKIRRSKLAEHKKEARRQKLRASNAISVYNPETTPLINVYYFFRLYAMAEEGLSKMVRLHRYGKSGAVGVERFSAFVEVALEVKPTALMSAVRLATG